MSQPTWRTSYRDATAAPPPPHAKERVWRAMHRPAAARTWRPVLALAVAAAAAVVLVLALTPRQTSGLETHHGFAVQATDAVFTRTGNRIVLEQGRLAVNAWSERVVIEVKGHRVEVENAVGVVQVAGESIDVVAAQGVVLLDEGVVHPRRGAAPAELGPLTHGEPAEALAARAEAEARLATLERRYDDAAAALSVVATTSSLRAEAALLKRGELELRALKSPAAALATFDEGEARFPSGALAEERALSALEASVALQRPAETIARADAFLVRFSTSGRADEVRRVRLAASQPTENKRP